MSIAAQISYKKIGDSLLLLVTMSQNTPVGVCVRHAVFHRETPQLCVQNHRRQYVPLSGLIGGKGPCAVLKIYCVFHQVRFRFSSGLMDVVYREYWRFTRGIIAPRPNFPARRDV